MFRAPLARRVLLCLVIFLLSSTASLRGEESLVSGRLVVVLQNALAWPTASTPPAVPRALVFTFSDWSSGKPHLEGVAVRDAQSEAACSSAAFSQGQLEATIKFQVKDRGRDSDQSGEVSIRASIEGTTGTGRYEGIWSPVSGWPTQLAPVVAGLAAGSPRRIVWA